MIKKINWTVFAVLILYPILLIALAYNYVQDRSIGAFEIGLFICGYYGSNIAVGVGLHRLWAHNAFKTNRVVEFILALLTAGTLQGPGLAWVSDHYKHHTYTDKDKDPHSPQKFQNRFLGFLWAHIGWMLVSDTRYKFIDKVTIVKLGKNKILTWQLKNYWFLAITMNTIVPALLGLAIRGTIEAAFASFLFIGLGRALQQQATFCVNSLCHYIGTKEYYKGTAGDIWWMAIFLLGENWHNFHHAFPSDYRNGAKWYHFDVHKWIIYLMNKVGLAWDLERTTSVRVQAKMNETVNYFIEARRQQLLNLKTKVEEVMTHFADQMDRFENSSIELKENFKKQLNSINDSLKWLMQQANNSSIIFEEKASDRILKSLYKRLSYTEQIIEKFYMDLGIYTR
jgi:stearoyl-CoA desaturase (delta-9 desaturase)